MVWKLCLEYVGGCMMEVEEEEEEEAYLIFVISFTRVGFLNTKFYTPKND